MTYQHDYNELLSSISAIVGDDTVFEIRCLTGTRRVDAGYFDSPALAANALLNAGGYYTGIYITPNPLRSDLLARSYNRINNGAEVLTHDTEVLSRRWLLIDIDPIRPKGISSTDIEHTRAIAKARKISQLMALCYGWPSPMINSSGNGCHLMYAIDENNTDVMRDAITKALRCMAAKWNDEHCSVDIVNFNAARIWRLPGTWARKGDNTPDRPHRQSKILQHVLHNTKVTIFDIDRFNSLNEHLIAPVNTSSVNKNRNEYPDDEKIYKSLNDHAMRRVKDWVPIFFPDARPYKEGYRVSSADLGLDHEEDLTIHPFPLGIKYFGIADQGDVTEGRRTPVGVIAQFCNNGDKAEAAKKLAETLKAPISEFEAIPAPSQLTVDAGIKSLLGSAPVYSFKSIRTVADLQAQAFKDQTWIVDGVIPTGNIMLASRPKMRKTWLALQLSLAIVTGRTWLGWNVKKGDVLALLLEDNERRLQNRIRTLMQYDLSKPDLSGFKYWTGGIGYDASGRMKVTNPEEQDNLLSNFPRGQAGVDALDQYLDMHPNTSTVIIDTWAHFRDNAGGNRDVYQRDYDAMMPITKLAARRNVLIIPVHHEKKGLANNVSGDFLEDVNGSSGITGGVDGVMSIKGKRGVQDENEERKLYISGRDIPHDYELNVAFDASTGGWRTAKRQDVKLAIKQLLETHPYINQKEMQALLPNVSVAHISKMLTELKFNGDVEHGRYGYSLKRV